MHTCRKSPSLNWSYNNTTRWKANKVAWATLLCRAFFFLWFWLPSSILCLVTCWTGKKRWLDLQKKCILSQVMAVINTIIITLLQFFDLWLNILYFITVIYMMAIFIHFHQEFKHLCSQLCKLIKSGDVYRVDLILKREEILFHHLSASGRS